MADKVSAGVQVNKEGVVITTDEGTVESRVDDREKSWAMSADVMGGIGHGIYVGPGFDASYCARLSRKLCLNMGLGMFGSFGSGPVERTKHADGSISDSGSELMMVPNLHAGVVYQLSRAIGLGGQARLGYARINGHYENFEPNRYSYKESYVDTGLYLEGAVRLLINLSSSTGLHTDFGVNSFPAAGPEGRRGGFMGRIGGLFRF